MIPVGDIGREIKRIELEPLPEDVPVEEPLRVPAPAEPVPQAEPVPA